MGEDFVAQREFDGFATAMRQEFKALCDKIDNFAAIRVQEARDLGEITSTIRSIDQRLERQEREADEQKKAVRVELDRLWKEQTNATKGKLNWVGQSVTAVMAALLGAFLARK